MGEVITAGLDMAKQVFQVHGVDGLGTVVVRRQLHRGEVLNFFAGLPRAWWPWRPAARRIIGLGSWER